MLFVVNLKTYSQGTGKPGIRLLKILEKQVPKAVKTIVCPQSCDINLFHQHTKIPLFAQHCDPHLPGKYTGSQSALALKDAGIQGAILNHSEHRIPLKQLKQTILLLRTLNLKSIICCRTVSEVKKYSALHPTYLAYEPPALIGGDISISSAKPDLIKKAVKAAKKIPLLAGAGIHNSDDIKVAMKLGCKGILISSAIVAAKNPQKAISNLFK